MNTRKKILVFILKLALGLLSFWLIYWRLKSELTPQHWLILKAIFSNTANWIYFLVCILLMPLNWGIETLKWQRITKPIEYISFKQASASVYSGIFAGNLAPGRATEFLAKILFFEPNNRAAITVLHFINGMFQLSITILIGLTALFYKTQDFSGSYNWIKYVGSVGGGVLLLLFIGCILYTPTIMTWLVKRFQTQEALPTFRYRFTPQSIFFFLSFSVIRYLVFSIQMALLLAIIGASLNISLFINIAIYFFITTTIPMVSFLEAAIRIAIALVVFKNLELSTSLLAIVSILLWLINIVLPSCIGYVVIIRKKINLSVLSKRQPLQT